MGDNNNGENGEKIVTVMMMQATQNVTKIQSKL